jgi:hypothetical protein
VYVVNRWASSAKENWDKTKVNFKDGTGVYVPVSFYNVPNMNMHSFNVLVESMRKLGYQAPIIGVRESDLGKLGDGWVHYRDYVNDALNTIHYHSKDSISDAYIKHNITHDTQKLYDAFANLDNDPFNFKQIYDFTVIEPNNDALSQVMNLVRLGFKYDFTKEQAIVDKLNLTKTKYPLLSYVVVDNDSLPHIKEYIEVMNR